MSLESYELLPDLEDVILEKLSQHDIDIILGSLNCNRRDRDSIGISSQDNGIIPQVGFSYDLKSSECDTTGTSDLSLEQLSASYRDDAGRLASIGFSSSVVNQYTFKIEM